MIQDLKKPIIDNGLADVVNTVIIPHSGWDRRMDEEALRQPRDVYWPTVFRNASGVIRCVPPCASVCVRVHVCMRVRAFVCMRVRLCTFPCCPM